MFFDQSKTNRNHEKLKVDFHCRVILLMLMAGVNLTGFSCVKPSVHFFSILFFLIFCSFWTPILRVLRPMNYEIHPKI